MHKPKPLIGFLVIALVFLSLSVKLSAHIDINVEGKINDEQQISPNTFSNLNISEYNSADSGQTSKISKEKLNSYLEGKSIDKINEATNPENKPINFKLQAEPENSSWYDIRWRYRKNITILASKVSEDLVDFPLLIDIFDMDLKQALNLGYDILFTNSDNNKLSHEIELFNKYYNMTHTHLIAWIKVNLSSTTDTTLMLYFGYPFANNQENPTDVWSNGYQAVYHLKEDPSLSAPQIKDSTNNNWDGTTQTIMTSEDQVTGKIAGSINFEENSADVITVGNIDSSSWSALTLSAWINMDDFEEDHIISKRQGSDNWWIGKRNNDIRFLIDTDGGGGEKTELRDLCNCLQKNKFAYLILTWDASLPSNEMKAFIDGVLEAETDNSGTTIIDSSDIVTIGDRYTGGRTFDGLIDEARISNIARSAGWIETEYNNQFEPESFYLLNSKEKYVLEQNWIFESLDYRKNITILSSQIDNDKENFRILVDLIDQDLFSKAQSNGSDILFTDSFGNRIEHQIEKYNSNYNSTHSQLITWVNIPNVSSTDNTIITIYYGNSTINKYDTSNGVWHDYEGIWHLSEVGQSPNKDSTGHGYNGDKRNNTEITGLVANGQDFDGSSDQIFISSSKELNPSSDATISGWFKLNDDFNSSSTKSLLLLEKYSDTSNNFHIGLVGTDYTKMINGETSDGSLVFKIENNNEFVYKWSNLVTWSSNTWYHFAVVLNENNPYQNRIYINGLDETNSSSDDSCSSCTLSLAFSGEWGFGGGNTDLQFPGNNGWFNGTMDEIRIFMKPFSNYTLLAEYYNQMNPNNFYSVGKEQIYDFQEPIVQNFGLDDSGMGQATFWANITDNKAGVATAYLEINYTSYKLEDNGSLWIYDKLLPGFNDYYDYRILNASDKAGNSNSSPSNYSNYTFNLDNLIPNVLNWEFFSELSLFKANVTDSWGVIDTVLINITDHDGFPTLCTVCYTPSMAEMQNIGGNEYINDTISLYRGTVTFNITAIDTLGNINSSEHQVEVLNKAPIVTNITLNPFYLSSNTSLTLSYNYTDSENDDESGTQIRWFRNGIVQLIFNDLTTISFSSLIRDDLWNATVKPKDGITFGLIYSSPIKVVRNSAPQLLGLEISPTTPTTSNDLVASWAFFDEDDDLQPPDSWIIRWYNNISGHISAYDDELTVPSSATAKNQEWWVTLRVYDGSEYSIEYSLTSYRTIINNSKPAASGMTIEGSPTTTDILNATWSYSDADSDSESPSWIIRWYRDGVLVSNLDNQISVPAGLTNKSDVWNFILQVFDGIDYSILYTSVSKIILNSAPEANSITLTTNPDTVTDLIASWGYYDADGDIQNTGLARIRWYRDGVLVSSLNDLITVPASITNKSEVWNYTVQVFDGEEFSLIYSSSTIAIQNTAPLADSITLITYSSTSSENLVTYWTYSDIDNDAENVSASRIRWYRNGVLQSGFNDETIIPYMNIARWDQWNFTVEVYDGETYSSLRASNIVTIINSAPILQSQASFNDTAPANNADFNISISYYDQDNDTQQFMNITWYVNGGYNATLDNRSTINYYETDIGQFWRYHIAVFDGTEWSSVYISRTIGIGQPVNSAPYADNLNLTVGSFFPQTNNTLEATYDYSDRDNDPNPHPEFGTFIYWYLDNGTSWVLQSQFNGSFTVASSFTSEGQIWYFTIVPKDVFPEPAGGWQTFDSSNITISNSSPDITTYSLTSNPNNITDLIASYTSFDPDITDALTIEILWYQNGLLRADLNNSEVIFANMTLKGDYWNYSIRVLDESVSSIWYNSSTTVILNTGPEVSGFVAITPGSPITSENLNANWNYTDLDYDNEGSPFITWYKNGVPTYYNISTISSSNTKKGENWYMIIRVYDGEVYSIQYISSTIQIGNSFPSATDLIFNPSNPVRGDNLQISYTWGDPDQNVNDIEIDTQIRWYKNGIIVLNLNDTISVPGAQIIKGDLWNVTITPSDGTNYGLMVFFTVLIENTPPQVSSVSITPSITVKTDVDITAHFSFSDVDNDPLTQYSLIWFNGSNIVPELNNQSIIPANYTKKGEQWSFEISVFDGNVWSLTSERTLVIVTIINSIPTIENLALSGGKDTNDNIVLSYDFIDNDLDSDATSIEWRINGASIFNYNPLNSSYFKAGDQIFVIVTPKDNNLPPGIGQSIVSFTLIVGNSAPIISSLPVILNENKSETFFVNIPLYVFFNTTDLDDLDSNPVFGLFEVDGRVIPSNYRWYRNNILVQGLNSFSVPIEYLIKGDSWKVSVKVFDRFGLSSPWINSSVIIIQNSKPLIQNIFWSDSSPTSQDNLIMNYEYVDLNDDEEGQSKIQWFINDEPLIENENQTILNNVYIDKGDYIYTLITPYDNELFGLIYNSGLVYVTNSIPEILNVEINNQQPTFTNDSLNLSWVYFDFDGDLENQLYFITEWYLNGEIQPALTNLTLINPENTSKSQRWQATLQVFDGQNYSIIRNSYPVFIQNSIISLESVQINSNESIIYTNGTLSANYLSNDLDNDPINQYVIYWYQNGSIRTDISNQTLLIPSNYLVKGDSWYFKTQITEDGIVWTNNFTSQVVLVINSLPDINNLGFIYPNDVEGKEFYLEDEILQLTYTYGDMNGDPDQSLIEWYKNDVLQLFLTNYTQVNSIHTSPGDRWYYEITPYDGENSTTKIKSSTLIIYSAPIIFEFGSLPPEIPTLQEGNFQIWVLTNDSQREIVKVDLVFDKDNNVDSDIIELIRIMSDKDKTILSNKSKDYWIRNIDIFEEYDRTIFKNYLNRNVTIEIVVYTEIMVNGEIFTITRSELFTLIIKDLSPPKVIDAYFNWNDSNTELVFTAIVEDLGSEIENVTLKYSITPKSETNTNSKLKYLQESFIFLSMNKINASYFQVSVPSKFTQDLLIEFNILVTDSEGNANNNGWSIGETNPILEEFINPGLPFEIVSGIVLFILVIAVLFTFVGIRKFRKRDVIGIDIEAIIEQSSKIAQENIQEFSDEHTLGILIATFDQSHGPVPIFIHPEILTEDIDRLIDIADRSFSSTRFVENFDIEIQVTFDYTMSSIIIGSLSYGFSLNRPEMRGGAENFTLNLLIHKPFDGLITQFLEVFSPLVHEVHLIMDSAPDEKDVIQEKLNIIREKVTAIILAYEDLYGKYIDQSEVDFSDM